MNVKPVALVAIVAENRMIGNKDDSPLPFDFDIGLKWMLHVESGATGKDDDKNNLKHNLVYGRRVYEEFAGYEVLPSGGGTNYVVSSTLCNPDKTPKLLPTALKDESTIHPRLMAVGSIEQALDLGSKQEKQDPKPGEMCLVLGGQRIYTDSLPKATFLRLIHMRTDFEGGILFPEYDEKDWKPIYKSKPKIVTNKVDGKDLEIQIIEYVRAEKADDEDLAPIIQSVRQVNHAFGDLEFLEE